MNWNYIGIDDAPPRITQILVLFEDGTYRVGNASTPNMVAWASVPPGDEIKRRCQELLGGLPELRMIAPILDCTDTRTELITALDNYQRMPLSSLVDLIRVLDNKAHNGLKIKSMLKRRRTDRE